MEASLGRGVSNVGSGGGSSSLGGTGTQLATSGARRTISTKTHKRSRANQALLDSLSQFCANRVSNGVCARVHAWGRVATLLLLNCVTRDRMV